MKKIPRIFLSILLAFVMVVGMVPTATQTVYAWDEETNCEFCGQFIADDWIASCGDHCSEDAGNGCYEENHCQSCDRCASEVDLCNGWGYCSDCAVDEGLHCSGCGECGPVVICDDCGICSGCADICEFCDRCYDCADNDHCSGCEAGCKVYDVFYCDECGLCENCVELCENCDWKCVECLSVEGLHCAECGVCWTETDFCGACLICYD